MKKAIVSRVLWFNGLCAGLVALETQAHIFKPFLGEEMYSLFVGGLIIGNAVLRYFTTEPIKRNKKKKAPKDDKQES